MDYIYGKNAVLEALSTSDRVSKVLIQNGINMAFKRKLLSRCKETSIPYVFVEKAKLDEINENHQGVVAHVSSSDYYDFNELVKEEGLIVLVDGITDTHNLGAIISSAYAFGAKGVVIPNRRNATLNSTVYKSSAGALSHMKVSRVKNIIRALKTLKENGFWIYGSCLNTNNTLFDMQFTKKSVIIIGSEDSGISKKKLEECDYLYTIPMENFDSLNASVAAGVSFCEYYRQNSE